MAKEIDEKIATADLTSEEEKAVRMLHGLAADDGLILNNPADTHPAARARLARLEGATLRIMRTCGRIVVVRKGE